MWLPEARDNNREPDRQMLTQINAPPPQLNEKESDSSAITNRTWAYFMGSRFLELRIFKLSDPKSFMLLC